MMTLESLGWVRSMEILIMGRPKTLVFIDPGSRRVSPWTESRAQGYPPNTANTTITTMRSTYVTYGSSGRPRAMLS